jgi:NAD(P)-dependent dehydrogenase (short-subunit alcohol dehydrogenase family)
MPTTLITGANRGLGLELTRRYLQRNWQVFALARSRSEELQQLTDDPGLGLIDGDLLDSAFVDGLADRLGGDQLDLLINNAGTMGNRSFAGSERTIQCLADFDRDEWRSVFETNVFAPMHVTSKLLPLLRDGAAVITLSSIMGSIAGNRSPGWYAYRSSKAAVNAMMKCMSLELEPRGIIAVALSPGWARTEMGGPQADLDVEESVNGMMRVIDDLEPGDSGKFLGWDGNELPY